MSVTAGTLPKIAFSKNHIVLPLQSDDYVANLGSKAITIISFPSVVNVGDTITLSWTLASVTFTAAGAPDNSGYQIPAGAYSPAYVQSVLPWIKANYFIDRDFEVLYTGTNITLRAKEKGVNYNIANYNFGMAANTTEGSNYEIKANFGHLVQVWVKGMSDQLVYDETLILDQPVTGITKKDIANVIDTELDYDIPDLNLVWQECPLSIKQYYIKYAQVYGEPPQIKRLYQTEVATACLGGYSEKALAVISDQATHLEKYLLPAAALYQFHRWFESFPVDHFTVNTNQPQFLYFVNTNPAALNLKVRATLTFSDGSTQVIYKPGGILNSMEKVCIGCGYGQLQLSTYTTEYKYVVSYTIDLVTIDGNDPRSLKKHFTVNREPEEYTRYIIYSSSDGNFKTLRTYGRSKPTSTIESSVAIKQETLLNPKTGNKTRYDIHATESDELYTGYIDDENDFAALEELFLAEKAFRVFGSTLVPILITSDKFEHAADAQNLRQHKIEYQIALEEKLYTGSTGALLIPALSRTTNALNDL